MKTYSVKEIFYSLQGEGRNAGCAAVFIRFAGCNVRCPWCDTDWSRGQAMSAEKIVETASKIFGPLEAPLLVLTGGEPALQIDEVLIDRLHTKFPVIAIETSGTVELPRGLDWITISPKEDFCPETGKVVVKKADEVKVVFDRKHDPEKWRRIIEANYYYLQPCDTGNAGTELNTQACVKYIIKNPGWRLSLQTHKILNIR